MYAQVVVITAEQVARAKAHGNFLDHLSVSTLGASPELVFDGGAQLPDLNVSLTLCCNASLRRPPRFLLNETVALLLGGLRSLQSEPGGWNTAISPGVEIVEVLDHSFAFRVPPSLQYLISLPETIEVVVPAAALENWDRGDIHPVLGEQKGDIHAEPLLRIEPRQPALRVMEDGPPLMLIPSLEWRPDLELVAPVSGARRSLVPLFVSDESLQPLTHAQADDAFDALTALALEPAVARTLSLHSGRVFLASALKALGFDDPDIQAFVR